MIFSSPRFAPLGDSALTITLGDEISPAMTDIVTSVATALRGSERTLEFLPSYAAVTVFYDGLHSSYAEIVARLAVVLQEAQRTAPGEHDAPRVIRIPVTYDGEDLDAVARLTGLSTRSVTELHASLEYRVYMLGFAPGFAYLGDIDARLALPRRDSPRKRVPAGSVAIAERQTAVYPSSTPGGWHLIGRTRMTMFDPARDPPATLRVGDRVRFEPVRE